MGSIVVGEVELVWDVHGHGAVTVVLVCGTGQPASMWLGLVEPLVAAGYRVVTFDNRGMPPSSCPTPPWTTDDMAADSIGLIEAVGSGAVHVLGASLGANIVHRVAMLRPDLVRSVVMMVGGIQFAESWIPIMRANLALYEQGVEPPTDLDLFTMMLVMLPPSQRGDGEAVGFVGSIAGSLTTGFGPGGRHGQYAANGAWIAAGASCVEELAELQPPALFVAHEHDPCFPLAGFQHAAHLTPDAELFVVPGVSHIALDPATNAATATRILEFLAAH